MRPTKARRVAAPAPAVSVVLAVYNGERYLRDALESVLAQTLEDLELVVVDDGSTDHTPDILREYTANDPRIRVYCQPNQGRARALNRGVALARAPVIARLDADDMAVSDRLERQRCFLAEHDDVALVGGAVSFVNESGHPFAEYRYPVTDAEIRRALGHTTPFIHSGVTLRKAEFALAGGYRPAFGDADDVDLWLRISERAKLANLEECVVRYRIHEAQATARGLEHQTLCALAARVAARARAAGHPDPFTEVDQIDRQTLLEHGATPAEITAELVYAAAWLARTMGRAGYADAQDRLFTQAATWANASSGSAALVASVSRQRARRHAEDGRWLRARVSRARAALAERLR